MVLKQKKGHHQNTFEHKVDILQEPAYLASFKKQEYRLDFEYSSMSVREVLSETMFIITNSPCYVYFHFESKTILVFDRLSLCVFGASFHASIRIGS